MPQTYAYIRVSAKDQNIDRQLIALNGYHIQANHIFIDRISGKNFDRPGYKHLIHRLKQDDTLIIKSIDRLGRNYDEILNQWRYITQTRGANIIVIDMPLLNTNHPKGDLIATFISDMVLQLLSYVAQTERELIKQRQAEGIAAALARGTRFGRQPKPIPDNFPQIYNLWVSGKISARTASKQLSVSPATFLRWCKNKPK